LFPELGGDRTVFDIAVNGKGMTALIQMFMNFMISSDTRGLLYSNIIDANLEKIFLMGIDLKPYYASAIPFH
jgi:hypothetical protein